MARQTAQQRELFRFLQEGRPSSLATFFSEHPQAAAAFLGLNDARQLENFNRLLKSEEREDIQYAFDRIDQALKKRKNLLTLFEEDTDGRAAPSSKKRGPETPTPGSAKAEFKENVTLKPYEAFRDSVRFLTESVAATLSLAGLNKKWRHVTELALGGTTFTALSIKAAAPLTGAVMSFAAATGDATAALPTQPDIYSGGQSVTDILHEFNNGIAQNLNGVSPSALAASFNRPLEITVTRDAAREQSPFRMMPELERHIARDPQAAQYVAWLQEAASACGIDGNLFSNQIYKESFWFRPEVIAGLQKSPKGALGIVQAMPATAKALGFDPLNPREAIFAAARHMCDLTKKYGDQQLAMVVYNGRADALEFAAEELGIPLQQLSIQRWIGFMQDRRAAMGTDARHAWHVETLGYIEQTSITASGPQFARTPALAAIGRILLPEQVPMPVQRPRKL